MHEGELGGPFYRRPEAVAVNGDLRRVITAVPGMCSGIRGLGIVVEVHRSHLGAKRAGIWCYGRARRNGGGAARRRQGARSVLAGPRRRCHGRALAWQGHAERQGALGGAGWHGERARALAGRHGRRSHRRSFQRRRGSSPPMPGIGQACVRCSGQGGEAVRNAPGGTGDG